MNPVDPLLPCDCRAALSELAQIDACEAVDRGRIAMLREALVARQTRRAELERALAPAFGELPFGAVVEHDGFRFQLEPEPNGPGTVRCLPVRGVEDLEAALAPPSAVADPKPGDSRMLRARYRPVPNDGPDEDFGAVPAPRSPNQPPAPAEVL